MGQRRRLPEKGAGTDALLDRQVVVPTGGGYIRPVESRRWRRCFRARARRLRPSCPMTSRRRGIMAFGATRRRFLTTSSLTVASLAVGRTPARGPGDRGDHLGPAHRSAICLFVPRAWSTYTGAIVSLVQEGLLSFADDLSLTAGVAESWEQVDPTTYRYSVAAGRHLRRRQPPDRRRRGRVVPLPDGYRLGLAARRVFSLRRLGRSHRRTGGSPSS